MYISRMSLPRRTVLRGLGAALALPLVSAARDILVDMATFADAGVTDTGR